jgi:pimeloyl-ACP methyl ester carboxylesterase
MAKIAVGAHEFEYRRIDGSRRGEPIVFLHHGFGSVSAWWDFPDELCRAAGRNGIVYSRLGCGQSSRLTSPYLPDFLTREAEQVLPELLDVLHIERAIPFGHSNGATITLLFAAAFPERVRCAIVEAPHVVLEQVSLDGIAKVSARYRSDPGLREKIARHHDDPDSAFWAWANVWSDPAQSSWNVLDRLGGIRAPLLVIHGDIDEYGTPKQVELIQERVRGTCEAMILPGCGHDPHFERRAAVIAAGAGFIERMGGRETAAGARSTLGVDVTCR